MVFGYAVRHKKRNSNFMKEITGKNGEEETEEKIKKKISE